MKEWEAIVLDEAEALQMEIPIVMGKILLARETEEIVPAKFPVSEATEAMGELANAAAMMILYAARHRTFLHEPSLFDHSHCLMVAGDDGTYGLVLTFDNYIRSRHHPLGPEAYGIRESGTVRMLEVCHEFSTLGRTWDDLVRYTQVLGVSR